MSEWISVEERPPGAEERDGERRRGWCHARPYDEMVTRDEDHPYMVVTMGTKCCRWRGATP